MVGIGAGLLGKASRWGGQISPAHRRSGLGLVRFRPRLSHRTRRIPGGEPLQLSPYAAALRLHLLTLDLPAPARTRFESGDLTGADRAWQACCGEPAPAIHQIRSWIAGAPCRRADCQPSGYVPPPKRNGRPVQVRKWHAEAGSAPDGVVAERHGVSLAAVRDYRRRNGVPAFKAATPPAAASKPTTP